MTKVKKRFKNKKVKCCFCQKSYLPKDIAVIHPGCSYDVHDIPFAWERRCVCFDCQMKLEDDDPYTAEVYQDLCPECNRVTVWTSDVFDHIAHCINCGCSDDYYDYSGEEI